MTLDAQDFDEDDTVVVMTPPSGVEVGTRRHQQAKSILRSGQEPSSRTRRLKKQLNVLVISQNPRVKRIVDELRPGSGVSAYALTAVSDRSRGAVLLRDPIWDAVILDEETFEALGTFPEEDRLRILRSAVIVTELGAAGPASMSAAECLPVDRLTRFSLDDTLCRIARRKMDNGKPKERETISDIFWSIARRNLDAAGDLPTAFRPLVETAARVLRLGRASVWRFLENPKRLRCEAMYITSTREFTSGIEIPASMVPGYCAALESHRLLTINDALVDPRSSELVPIYLRDAGVGALLDAPIYLDGSVAGLFCAAHVGGPRSWTEAEQYVAASFSDYAQLALRAYQQRQTDDIVRAQRSRMQRGQRLEILGAMANIAVNRSQHLFGTIAESLQNIIRHHSEQLGAGHAQLLTAQSACEEGLKVTDQVKEFNPAAQTASAPGVPADARHAAQAVSEMIRQLNVQDLAMDCSFTREEANVSCNLAALKSAYLSMSYQALTMSAPGGSIALSTKICRSNGRTSDVFEFAVTCSGRHPIHEFEAGLVLASSFAASVGATLEVVHVQEGTRAALRIPLTETGSLQRPRDQGSIAIVADIEEPSELVDVLRFFKYNPVVLSTQECLTYLREHQHVVKMLILDASNSELPVRERLRPLRLATTRPILIIGSEEDCVGIPTDDIRLKTLPESSLAMIAAHIEQALGRSAPTGT